MSEVKEDGCFSAHVRDVQNSNLSMQDSSNQNRNDSSQTESHSPESAQQHFRNVRYDQVPGPLEAARKLHELCYQWLAPETNSKEQILEALVLEQFLSILPQAMKNWVQKHHLQDVKQAVALVECLQTEPDAVPNEPENNMGNDQPESASTSEIEARPSKGSKTRKKAAQKKNNRESQADTRRVRKRGQALPGRKITLPSTCKQQRRKPFKCQEYGKDVRVPSGLVKHKRVHNTEKSFSCQQCG
ncbi:hypothetical protein A6R68_15072, partial [Neotoma lepida]